MTTHAVVVEVAEDGAGDVVVTSVRVVDADAVETGTSVAETLAVMAHEGEEAVVASQVEAAEEIAVIATRHARRLPPTRRMRANSPR